MLNKLTADQCRAIEKHIPGKKKKVGVKEALKPNIVLFNYFCNIFLHKGVNRVQRTIYKIKILQSVKVENEKRMAR